MRTRKVKIRDLPEDWEVSTSVVINGRHVTLGTELSIRGVPGRFRFIKHVKTKRAEWIDVVGGRKGVTSFRSFEPTRVKTVHRVNKTRENLKG